MRIEHICSVCPLGCHLVYEDGVVTGNTCDRGYKFMMDEIVLPKRNISSTVKITGSRHKRLPVKTNKPIPREKLVVAVEQLNDIEVTAPISLGDIILENILDTGSDFVATRTVR